MESLMCDEVLVFTPPSAASPPPAAVEQRHSFVGSTAAVSSRNDLEEAVGFLVEKEMSYMPKLGYVNHLQSNSLIYHARHKAISWIIQVQKRLNVSMETAFYAANYLDRFISLNKCQGWERCTFDLLSVACLYVASKLNETHPPPLHALQMEGLGHPPFGSSMIGRMEMSLLRALEWKLLSTTTYSYLQLMETLQDDELKTRATHMLLQTLLDPTFLEFRPSLVAESVLRCTLNPQENDKNQFFHHFSALIPQDQKDDMMKKICEMMEKGLRGEEATTWEKKEEQLCCRECDDCSVLLGLELEDADLNIDGSSRKRKRDTYC